MNDQANSVDERFDETPATLSRWNRHDTTWMLGLFGTAIGAGTLFLPINAGLGGFWPLLILALLAFPMTIVSVEVPLGGITAGTNCLSTVGGVETTTRAELGSSLVTPSVVVTPPAAIVLV